MSVPICLTQTEDIGALQRYENIITASRYFFTLNFLPWDFSLIKKLEIKKKLTTPSIQLLKLI